MMKNREGSNIKNVGEEIKTKSYSAVNSLVFSKLDYYYIIGYDQRIFERGNN